MKIHHDIEKLLKYGKRRNFTDFDELPGISPIKTIGKIDNVL